jgi:hypothetical protein
MTLSVKRPVRADQLRLAAAAVGPRHFDLRRAVNDVAVGQDEAVRREDESRIP